MTCFILNTNSGTLCFLFTLGHSIVGLERLPDTGPAMIIYYHGALPIDFYYLMSRCILEKQRNLHAVGDNFLFKIPGFYLSSKLFEALLFCDSVKFYIQYVTCKLLL